MPNLNKVLIMGTLTRDPEIKYTPKGTAIADIGLAVNRTYKADNGEQREDVTFVDVTLWGRVAEIVGEYCKKGRPLFVEGRLQLDTWDDKASGQKRSKLKVVGENIQLIGGREEGSGSRPQGEHSRQARPPARQPTPKPPADPDLDAAEDDIPFSGEAHEYLIKNMLQVRRIKAADGVLHTSTDGGWSPKQVQRMHQIGFRNSGSFSRRPGRNSSLRKGSFRHTRAKKEGSSVSGGTQGEGTAQIQGSLRCNQCHSRRAAHPKTMRSLRRSEEPGASPRLRPPPRRSVALLQAPPGIRPRTEN